MPPYAYSCQNCGHAFERFEHMDEHAEAAPVCPFCKSAKVEHVLTNVFVMLIIVQFVIGLLLAFNVVSRGNDFVVAVYRSINSLLDPVLSPIRRMLPQTGAIDFSPLVLIILLNIVLIVLGNVIYG